jgi:hypothetical protein
MTTAGLTALGPCPACGHLRHLVAGCTCGHTILVHLLGTSKGATVRTGCTHSDAGGQCRCKRFAEVAHG